MARRQALIFIVVLNMLVGIEYAAPQVFGQRIPVAARPPVLIGLMHPQSVWVVGAYDAKQGWQNDKRSHPFFKPGMRFSIFDVRGPARTATISKIEKGEAVGGYVADTNEKVEGTPKVALFGASRPVVRRPRVQSLLNPLYQEAAAVPLRKGLPISRAHLTQHLRVDLNGDGVEEVLLCAHSRSGIGSDLRAFKGDYSLAALRFVSEGKPKMLPLAMESYKHDQPFGSVAASRFEFLGCFDINGDGRMEIVLYSQQFEADGIQIFTFDGKTPRRVLTSAWGL